ncbi:unnamed protein product [Closterium sp. NIES-64]|nr:unnamed protein product [Closterium sp. NIES-64]
MARNDSAVSPRLFRGRAMILLLALLIPDPTGLETGRTGGGTGHFAEALPFIEPSQPAAMSRAFMPKPKGRILLSPRASACHPSLSACFPLSLSPPQSSFQPQPLSSPPSALLLGKPPFPPFKGSRLFRSCQSPTSISFQIGFDTIPDVITKLTRLTNLLSPPSSHLPVSASPPCEPLTSLNLEFVAIRGTLPASMGNMTNLQELTISRVESGSIPASFGNMASLQSLIISVSDNDTTGDALTGPILESFSNLKSLTSLDLTNNNIGPLTNSIGTIPNLEYLKLKGNNFTGSTIPSTITALTNLVELSLDYTGVGGSIPSGLGLLSDLQIL